MSRLLIVEDEPIIRAEARRLLQREGHEVAEAQSVAEAEAQHDLSAFDLILADLRLPGAPGTDLIARAQGVPVLIVTSYATVRSAVEAMRQGAVDYLAKPFDHDELLLVVERVLQQGRLARRTAALEADVARTYAPEGMVGRCRPMQEVFERVRKVAPTDATVLVLGESGTGKELVARAIHLRSPRRGAPLVPVNCAAIPPGLIESELFGHEKGAFTGAHSARPGLFEAADGGTLFLDEVAELPPPVQAQLLRVLQEGEVRRVGANRSRRVDVRLVAATHRDLTQYVAQGAFRQDLYFRLKVVEVRLPPLRERAEDLPELAQALLDRASARLNRAPQRLPREVMAALEAHHWPGNVRELENTLERAVILAEGGPLTADLLAIDAPPPAPPPPPPGPEESLEDYFKRFVLEHQGHLSETELARRLGISRKALWERRQRFGLPRPRLM